MAEDFCGRVSIRLFADDAPLFDEGAGVQHAAAEGLPERCDAVGDALSGHLCLSVAGQGPQGQNGERVQVRVAIETVTKTSLPPAFNPVYPPLLNQSLRVSVHAALVRAGGRRGRDLCRRRAERGPVSAARPHPDRGHVSRQKEGQKVAQSR